MAALTLEDIHHLADEIRHLVSAGLPLEDSLAHAGRGRGQRLEQLTKEISDGLNQGRSLKEIVEAQPTGVSRMLVSAVGAGVQSGDLGLTIEMMGNFASDLVQLRSRLLQSAAYPLTVVAVACLLMVLVVQNSLDRLLDALVEWDVPATPVLLTLLSWNRDYPAWSLVLPGGGVLLIGFWIFSGRASAMAFKGPERALLLLPGVWALVRDLQNYTVSRMLSLLTERGIPLPDSLVLAGGASGSDRLENACQAAADRVARGLTVVEDGKVTGPGRRLPPLLAVCLKQVEHDEARMVHRLQSVATFYRSRLERNSTWIKLMMPALMFIVIGGGCVLAYATILFWPITELYRNIGI